ncbi:GNAT family N-acetyltransferase [Paenactinomyces guangxiensis]|uniref:GNAT family N-acetyltransferase n=1 Tax=Paenactinomyces guangxiensis TaxID=1490290 RepID=A0A7W1WT15_9BACL|nr:GNAT family N-acetyltransferase [Paenactinomyces guangxiensis]MBH8592415.1 GNAT family N-acetyltransferase [Paenactinomyces guangxiensis]
MRLRSFQLSDVHDVSQIWQMTASHEQEKETLQVLSKQLGLDRDLVLVAEAPNGKVVGAIVGTLDGSSGFFYCLAVHPDYQKQRVGTRLVNALEQRFLQKGVKRIWITVDEGTEKLLPFYQHLGYTNSCSTRLEKDLLFSCRREIN